MSFLSTDLSKKEMAPYMQLLPSSIEPPSSSLLGELQAKNEAELKRIDEKIKDAEDSLGETDVSEGLRDKAGYLCRIGDKDRALAAIDVAFEKTAGVGAKIDLTLAKIRLGLFYGDYSLIEGNITKATE